jgi:heavy metal sensor kinase
MSRLPIRWRLTIWYAALLAATCLVLGLGLYVAMRWRLHEGFDEQLRNQAAVTLGAVQTDGGTPILTAPPISAPDGEYLVRVFDANGRLVEGTGGMPADIPFANEVTAALQGTARYSSVSFADGETLRIISVPIHEGEAGPIIGALQLGLDRAEIDDTLREVLVVLLIAMPLALAAAGAGGYVLAGKALKPVATITELAARIDADDLHARLLLDLPDDELGTLARTFDGMLARIDDAFERQRRFTGDAAHELRTPLSLMRSQIDLALAQPRSGEAYREALRGLEGDLERLTGLVATLLTLARADSGQLVPDRATFNLAETIDLVMEHYASLAERAGITLSSTASATSIHADEDLLVQALVNLTDNALAHTPPGGRIIIGFVTDHDHVRLWVEDTGSGIQAEHQLRVFDRFYRVDAGRALQGGIGLGLAIVRAIATAHGGSVHLTSREGAGTRVELILPSAIRQSSR